MPSWIGWMNAGQRRAQTVRKERMSRPECLVRESKTAEQKRTQTSFVRDGSCGVGSVSDRICISSWLV